MTWLAESGFESLPLRDTFSEKINSDKTVDDCQGQFIVPPITREKNNLSAQDSFGSGGPVVASTSREAYLQPDSLLLLPYPTPAALALPQTKLSRRASEAKR